MPAHTADTVPVDAVPCDGAGNPLVANQQRPTFHVSHGMVCFGAGIGITLLILWIAKEMGKDSKRRD